MAEHKPLHPDIPLDIAWISGRSLFVKCGKGSDVDLGLRELGARWDWDTRSLRVGTAQGKREKAAALVLTQIQKAQAEQRRREELIAAGHFVHIPADVDATRLFAEAGKLGAGWQGVSRRFALPTAEAKTALQALVDAATAEAAVERQRVEAERAERRKREAQEARQAAIEDARRAEEQIIARSGRTPTGQIERLETVSTRVMRREQAEQMAWALGSVHRLRDGHRGLVVARTVRFVNADDATDLSWHPDAPDEAHWLYAYRLVIVEPTEAERAHDAAADAERADGAALHALFRALARLGAPVDAHTPVPRTEQLATITGDAGTPGTTPHHTGTVILTRDDRVVWQHPGFYDDYQRAEAVVTDPEQVAQVRALVDAGARIRHVHDQLTYTYTITPATAVDTSRAGD